MRRPWNRLRAWVLAVNTVGAVVILQSIVSLQTTPHRYEWLFFAALTAVAGSFSLKIGSISARVTISDTFFITTALLFGPAPATLAVALGTLVSSWRRGHARERVTFNTCTCAFAIWTGSQVFFWLAGVPPLTQAVSPVVQLVTPLLALTAVYFVSNTGLIAVAVALDARRPVLAVWREHFLWLVATYFAAASVSFCLVLLMYEAGLPAAILVLPLLLVLHLTLRSSIGRVEDAREHLEHLDRLYLSTVETLAMAIDAKDDVTHSHVRRVQAYALGLARALGVNDEETLKAIEAAALLHDTGKLAVPEHILNKPGKLSELEFEQMKRHVDVGADILSLVDFPYPVVPIVRCHHENWDGSGYPRGVRGDDIPIGARILSVVDCYDALTSDRPYRRALDREAATAILVERRGTMYDPVIVDTFIRILPQIAEDVPPPRRNEAALAQISQSAATMVPAPPPVEATPDTVVEQLGEIVSLTKVVNAASSYADVLALASATVRRVVGRGTCAIYLVSPDGRTLTVEHASGPLAEPLTGTSIEIGQKLSGWVAAHRRTIVNSDAQLDLCEVLSGDIGPHACLSTALCDGDTLAGVLTVYRESSKQFAPADAQAFELMAPHLARLFTQQRQSRPGAAVRDLRVVGGSQSRLHATGATGALAALQEKRVRRLHEREAIGHRSPAGHS